MDHPEKRDQLLATIETLRKRVGELERLLGDPSVPIGGDGIQTRDRTAQQIRWLCDTFEGSPAPLIGLDREGRVALWSAGAESLFGWSRAEAVGRPNPTVPPGREKEFEKLFSLNFVGQSPTVRRLERQRKDGKILVVNLSTSPVTDADGELILVLGVFVDMTEQLDERRRAEQERIRLEEQLHQSQKLEAIGRLAGGVAHDFNNLLTVILGFADLLLATLAEGDASRESVREIHKAASSGADLTRSLLAFSRRQVRVPRVLDPNEELRRASSMLTRLIGEDIALRLELGDDPGNVRIDPSQLDQVLVNLAVNARDAMPDGGLLVVETRHVALDEPACQHEPEATPGSYVVVSVSDNGVGMSEEIQRRLFEPFFTTKRASGGTGLGLSTVYGIVKQNQGFLTVRSRPGVGTTFKVFLPVTREETTRQRRSSTELRALTRGTGSILVVEDREEVRTLAQRALARHGYQVLEAADGEEALRVYETSGVRFDLLLSDVIMPGMNGRELYEQLQRRQPDLRVLFMSGYSESIVAVRGELPEEVDFLQKPFSVARLVARVREILERGSASAAAPEKAQQ